MRDHLPVTIAVITVLVLLVGLPLAAVWWSRRGFWSRLRPGRERDVWGDVMRAHRLDAAAMGRVEGALWSGRRLADPTERAAVVALARASTPPGGLLDRRPRLALVLLAVGAVVVLFVAQAVTAAVDGRWGDVPWFTVLWLVPFGWLSAAPRRALRRNAD